MMQRRERIAPAENRTPQRITLSGENHGSTRK